MVTSISPGFHHIHGVPLARSLGTFAPFPYPIPRGLRHAYGFPTFRLYAPSDCLEGLGAFGTGLPCLLSHSP